ncbi:MAG: hypothetical protein ACKOCX_02170 [Planctomycetota bacterium]
MPATDPLSETKACDLLARLFRARGYAVNRNIPFREYGVSFHIDGWDPKARVGFEFLTSEDEDHDDLTLDEYKTLMDAQQRGELSLFIVDEVEPLSAAELTGSVEEFLDEVARASAARRSGRRAGKKKVPTAKKAPAGKKQGRKPKAATKAPTKKAARKKKAASRPVKKKARRRT